MGYLAYLHKDRDSSDFGVSFPDFPVCITTGRTLEEAQHMAAEALALHIAGMVEDGETIPEPSTLDALAEDPAMKHAVAFLVHVEPEAEGTVRINITARAKQVELIDRLAGKAGMTRSAYMVQGVRAQPASLLPRLSAAAKSPLPPTSCPRVRLGTRLSRLKADPPRGPKGEIARPSSRVHSRNVHSQNRTLSRPLPPAPNLFPPKES